MSNSDFGMNEKFKWVIRITSGATAIGLIILGIFDFLAFSISSPIDIIIPVYYM